MDEVTALTGRGACIAETRPLELREADGRHEAAPQAERSRRLPPAPGRGRAPAPELALGPSQSLHAVGTGGTRSQHPERGSHPCPSFLLWKDLDIRTDRRNVAQRGDQQDTALRRAEQTSSPARALSDRAPGFPQCLDRRGPTRRSPSTLFLFLFHFSSAYFILFLS